MALHLPLNVIKSDSLLVVSKREDGVVALHLPLNIVKSERRRCSGLTHSY